MLNKYLLATLFTLVCFVKPAQSLEPLEVGKCLQKNNRIENTILSAFEDKNPKPNHPKSYYQVGVTITRGEPNNLRKSYITYLIVKKQDGVCLALNVDTTEGYEIYVPGKAAITMEIKDFQWKAKNLQPLPPEEEIRDVDPAEFGHGCEPVTISQAQAWNHLKYEFICPVSKKRLPLIWDSKSP